MLVSIRLLLVKLSVFWSVLLSPFVGFVWVMDKSFVRPCLQEGRVTLVLGYPSKRVTLALAHFFLFSTTRYKAARVTLALG